MSDSERIRTPREIIDEFAEEARMIMSGKHARLDINSTRGGEVGDKFQYRGIVTKGRGHSVISCRDGNAK